MSDKSFRKTELVFAYDWTEFSSGSNVDDFKYRPDKSFKKTKSGKFCCIIESSSTGDRKVSIGELLQAESFFSRNMVRGILIFSLSGRSKTSPTPSTQKAYLEPYFNFLKSKRTKHGVSKVYFIKESDFESIGWEVLTDKFMEKAAVLS